LFEARSECGVEVGGEGRRLERLRKLKVEEAEFER